ncbi:MAG: DUF2442 domain-containing protein [Leptolyngbyaceae cyanobacterium SL_7_1]|nr:DUF2442 domain-containing protein [Leptolyngbyaceae cyanobacterium SL_7_1]
MFLHVEKFEYLEAYKLRLTLSNHVTQDVDLANELYGEIFEPLKDIELFKQVFLNPETNTIEWANGADFAPEFLYDLGQSVPQIA